MRQNKYTQTEQIAAQRSLLSEIKKANSQDLQQIFDLDLDSERQQLAELAVTGALTGGQDQADFQKAGLLVKTVDPSNPESVMYSNLPVAEVIRSEEFQDVILPLGNATLEQAQAVVSKADGLVGLRDNGILPNLASNLHQVDDIRDGVKHFPRIQS